MTRNTTPASPTTSRAWRAIAAMLFSVLLAPTAAFADATAPAAPAAAEHSTAAPAAAPAAWDYPLDTMRVTGFFGVVRPTTPKGLSGLDLAARRGTPVHAAADGIASVSEDARLGKAVRIDHGGGWQSLYAHLDSVNVVDGEAVTAAQAIATVGDSGRATGPHLHFQVWHHGRLRDPQSRLAGLDANASARALRMRKEQLGR